jgi:hypothetical protein
MAMGPRGSAAEQLLASLGGGGGGMEEPPMPEEAGAVEQEAALAGEEAGAMDLETALAGVDAALEGMGEDVAREVRSHIEAIRDIASRESGEAPAEEEMPAEGMAAEAPEMPGADSPLMGEEPMA